MAEPLLDCLIVGAGPAGLVAATYLARFRRRIALVGAGRSRADYITVSHNCPGFPFGIAGAELLAKLRAQAAEYGAVPIEARVDALERTDGGFVARAAGRTWRASTVLIATGVVDRLPDVEGVDDGIAAAVVRICAVCDAYEARDGRIAVLGPPATVLGHACFLRTYSRSVTAVLSERGVADAALRAKAQAFDVALRERPDVIALERDDDGTPTGCRLAWGNDVERFDTLYPVLGADAKGALAVALGARTGDGGELVVDEKLQTSVDGLYAAGDVVSALNQIAVAVGHAAIAASAIHNRLPRNALR